MSGRAAPPPPSIPTTSERTSPGSSWTELICRAICWQASLRPCWGPRGRGAGQVPFLPFYIYVLRFQDTWKGFAPSLLIGYKPWGSLLIYVPDESKASCFPSPLGLISTSGCELASGGLYTIPKCGGRWTLPAVGTWIIIVYGVIYTNQITVKIMSSLWLNSTRNFLQDLADANRNFQDIWECCTFFCIQSTG